MRDRFYGRFRRYPSWWWSRYDWYLPFYNTRYPYPLYILTSLAVLPLALSLDALTQASLNAEIDRVQREQEALGLAPPNAVLVPDFSEGTDQGYLRWAEVVA